MRLIKEHTFFKILINPLIVYGYITFFLGFGDALMSYAAPVYVENAVNNPLIMGIIFSTSSMFGLFLDIFIDKFLPNGSYKKYLKITFLTTVAFPLTFLLFPPNYTVLVIGMAFWGAYYEFKGFSSYNFIHKFVKPEEHTVAWSIVSGFASLAYFLGPAVAVLLIEKGIKTVFFIALFPFILGALIYFLFIKYHAPKKDTAIFINEKDIRTSKEQLTIFMTLVKRIWPLVLYTTAIYLIDSAFWTIGILFTEELKDTSKWGSLLLTSYMAPSVFIGLIAPKVHKHLGKKRTSFVSAIIAGLLLIFIGRTQSIGLIITTVFVMSIFLNLSSILNLAVFEDYVARLGKFGNDMAGIEQASGSIAYIIGPILWGGLASLLGYQRSFAITGVIFASIAIACLASIPRKIHMPQTKLEEVLDK
jgi:MFS family permease